MGKDGEDPKASDENDGSKEAPLKTIQAAATLAKGGDLRIMYPAPEVCLDLKSWREFYGFDQTGSEGWFEFEIDTEKLTLEIKKSDTTPPSFGGVAPGRFAYAPKELQRVAADPRVSLDLLGNERQGDQVVQGPFAELEFGKIYSIDPRVL